MENEKSISTPQNKTIYTKQDILAELEVMVEKEMAKGSETNFELIERLCKKINSMENRNTDFNYNKMIEDIMKDISIMGTDIMAIA